MKKKDSGVALWIIIVIILILIAFLLVALRQCGTFGSVGPTVPTGISITPPSSQIPAGGNGSFTVTVTTGSAPASPMTFNVSIEEDDYFDDVLINTVAVTVPAGATTGSAPFSLECTSDLVLKGADNPSDKEDSYQIHAEYHRAVIWNLTSDNRDVTCVAAEEETEQEE